ncbi:MAG: hypothetical protein AAGE80_05505 [Pseudomonadota bacterium]
MIDKVLLMDGNHIVGRYPNYCRASDRAIELGLFYRKEGQLGIHQKPGVRIIMDPDQKESPT